MCQINVKPELQYVFSYTPRMYAGWTFSGLRTVKGLGTEGWGRQTIYFQLLRQRDGGVRFLATPYVAVFQSNMHWAEFDRKTACVAPQLPYFYTVKEKKTSLSASLLNCFDLRNRSLSSPVSVQNLLLLKIVTGSASSNRTLNSPAASSRG